MGNSASDEQFYEHFDYLIAGLHRATMPVSRLRGCDEYSRHERA